MIHAIGQRWLWNKGCEKAVAEVFTEQNSCGDYKVKVIQDIKGNSLDGYRLNDVFTPAWYLDSWSYLEGQDRP